MYRYLRTSLPLHPQSLFPRAVRLNKVRNQDHAFQETQWKLFDRRCAVQIQPLRPGASVRVGNCEQEAIVLWLGNRPSSYVVGTLSGAIVESNRRCLISWSPEKPCPNSFEVSYGFPRKVGNRCAELWPTIAQPPLPARPPTCVSHDGPWPATSSDNLFQ